MLEQEGQPSAEQEPKQEAKTEHELGGLPYRSVWLRRQVYDFDVAGFHFLRHPGPLVLLARLVADLTQRFNSAGETKLLLRHGRQNIDRGSAAVPQPAQRRDLSLERGHMTSDRFRELILGLLNLTLQSDHI